MHKISDTITNCVIQNKIVFKRNLRYKFCQIFSRLFGAVRFSPECFLQFWVKLITDVNVIFIAPVNHVRKFLENLSACSQTRQNCWRIQHTCFFREDGGKIFRFLVSSVQNGTVQIFKFFLLNPQFSFLRLHLCSKSW